jgi:uncharacterized protein DUF2628
MATFCVLARGNGPFPDEDVVVMRDGFSWTAAVFGPFWALAHRLWWQAAALLAVGVAIGLAGEALALAEPSRAALSVAFALLVGWHGADWRASALERRGWRPAGVIVAPSLQEAERRLFARAAS